MQGAENKERVIQIKPILYNTEMVKAILQGRKTQTRRICKGQPQDGVTSPVCIGYEPPYKPNDILWVREAWCNLPVSPGGHTRLMRGRYYYRADVPDIRPDGWKVNWKPSIHMPKEAARIFLRVKCIRADKLQDSFNDIVTVAENFKAEGIDLGEHCENCIDDYGNPKCSAYIDDDGMMTGECHMLDDIRTAFSDLWDETVKPTDRQRYGWAANPWVWVIEFERIEKPEEWV